MPGKDIKMNYRNGFEVNLVEKQITLTKKFARRVSDMNSPEYATFMRLRTVYPQFAIVKYTIEQKAKRENTASSIMNEWRHLLLNGKPVMQEHWRNLSRRSGKPPAAMVPMGL